MASFDRPTPEWNQQSPLRSLLTKLFSGWSTNNAAGAQSSPYKDVSAQGMVEAVRAPGHQNLGRPDRVNRSDYVAPSSNTLTELSGVASPSLSLDVPPAPAMTDANLPAGIRAAAPQGYVAPEGSLGGMEITEGENANIDDDTRARALAWALRQQGL